MPHSDFKMPRAIGTLVGSVVGAGVFGLPYAFAQSGVAIGAAWLLGMGVIMLFLYLMYAEVVIQTPGTQRLGGYAGTYLGKPWKWISTVLLGVAQLGAMLAYVVIGGRFLSLLIGPFLGGPEWIYGLAMAAAAAFVTRRGLMHASRIEGVVVGLLLFLFVLAIFASLPFIQVANLTAVYPSNAWLPYGVVLFALSGLGAVPEVKDVLGTRAARRLPHAVTVGLFIITGLYLAFAMAVVGVTGSETTPSAFAGLAPVLGPSFAVITSLIGVVTLLSTYAMSNLQLQNALRFDVGVPRVPAWLASALLPPAAYLLGLRDFVPVIGFVGAVFSGAVGIILVATYERMRRHPVCRDHKCFNAPKVLSVAVVILFALGIIFEILDRFGL